jgi:uncharacterized protein (TIGR03790 family)
LSLLLKLAALGLGCAAALFGAAAEGDGAAALAPRVLILANSDDPGSLRIARHYADVRGVPAANIIVLKLPLAEEVTWREFVAALWQPLITRLVADGWIDAMPMALTDAAGRQKYAPRDHRIAALVTCRGVPLKIAHDPEFFAEFAPYTRRPEFRTNQGAVDSELSLLAVPSYPINAYIPNPLFQNEHPTAGDLAQVVKVSRLDGPTVEDANALVDRAVAAERRGLLGRAYVDIARRDNVGDPWLETTAGELAQLGFEVSVDREPATLPLSARFDAPVLYFGWYAADITGPFNLPGFRFPPGAIALHIHSFSAASLRQVAGGWTGPFIARGVTATVGNVYEPYLQLTHQPHLFLRALARGANLVDAAYFSTSALSWQAIVIGDPLFRPFAVPLAEQLNDAANLSPALAGYAVLRRVNELDRLNRAAEATALAVAAQRDAPSLAVGLALAARFRAAGDNERAGNALGFVPLLRSLEPDQWALAREVALLLALGNRPARALEVWRLLLTDARLPRELRLAWLPEGVAAAAAAADEAQARAWQAALDGLTVPAVKK